MKKETFISILTGTLGGLLFAIGMCMCLLPEWNMFRAGVVCTVVGAVVLIALCAVSFVRSGNKISVNPKFIGKVLFGIFSVSVFGLGMSMIMVWNMMLTGLIVGIAGVALILCLIPMCVGFKK